MGQILANITSGLSLTTYDRSESPMMLFPLQMLLKLRLMSSQDVYEDLSLILFNVDQSGAIQVTFGTLSLILFKI
jgi:hypothetical protein